MFIALEGIEGAGKTTQIQALNAKLASLNITTFITAEPKGGGELGIITRKILKTLNDIDRFSEVFLICAARRKHVMSEIIPALKQGQIVICDRFYHSSIAYFTYRHTDPIEKEMEMIKNLHNIAANNLMPDITFFLDIPCEVSQQRVRSRADYNNSDKYDRLGLAEIEKLRDAFLQSLNSTTESFIIDGTLSSEKITDIMLKEILSKLAR